MFVKANHVGSHTAKSYTERETQMERRGEREKPLKPAHPIKIINQYSSVAAEKSPVPALNFAFT